MWLSLVTNAKRVKLFNAQSLFEFPIFFFSSFMRFSCLKKTENIRIKVRFGRVHVNVFAVKKLYILSVCVCVCVRARMDRVVPSLVTCLAVPYFSALSHKRLDFRETFRQQKCVFWISVQLFLPLLILRRIERYIIINVHTSSYKVLVFLVGF